MRFQVNRLHRLAHKEKSMLPLRSGARTLVTCVALGLSAACGGGNDVTGPSAPSPTSRIPAVAGSYAGTITVTFPELNRTVSCPTSTSVTQNGGAVSIAPLQLSGQCGSSSVPLGSVTIDTTGAMGQDVGSYTDPSCGTYNYVGSGGFFGRDMRISIVYTSATCYNMNITINLTKA